MVVAPAIPDLFEEELHSVLAARTESLPALRELGPPDLVHLVKQPAKSPTKQFGVYHHVTGVDASTSASLAAYINTLTYTPHDKTNKVAIPGTVEAYCIDERDNKRVATDDLWLETYLCSVLRAYSYADDGTGESIKRIIGVRRFNPITSTDSEHKFMDAAERLFFNGWQLGSDPEIQVPNLVSNHLTTGLLNYIHTTGRYASGINLFEKLRSKDPEISSLLARVYFAADEEVKAVQLLHEAIQELPMDYSLLDCQAEFCNKKNRPDLALEIAKRSVVSAPSEFGTWARLAEIYISMEDWDLALLTLNSCPMFTYQDKDAPRLPEPLRVSLPILPESMCDEIDDSQTPDMEMVHPQLRKLHAASFKGTFLKAYTLLTEITKKIGWDQLLKIRSQVFVMEEEYRNEKQTVHSVSHSRNASTTALRSSSPATNGHGEDGRNKDDEDAEKEEKDDDEDAEKGSESDDSASPSQSEPSKDSNMGLERPQLTVASEVVHAGGSDDPEGANNTNYTQFRNKRLCERWLDNLFMVLYEDLRVYTIWRTEMAQYRQQQLVYKKSAEEWEILGELADRLHHYDEAVEAYQACLGIQFSPRAMKGVLKMYEKNGDVRLILGGLIRLVTWQYRWYSEFSPVLLFTVRKLIEDEGGVKVRSIIQGTSMPQNVLDLTHHYAQLCSSFKSSGSES
ncbi:chaps-domain-containing protein [Eremomyces bilateralis CBS 781.70]|uniref:Chaps-domain-containing protein n=1 Tax=Eremomyces bilateralis CBS 781.70 TaxID=1392243 RepID=A0A6G1G4N3_9PEZI|nr:chaps-domain-containing protein [Eremomyces bilateralis CBS 781.70]KAF1812978.1 chaps-domain-containing protein [Eremomyces bilateralis CBS 781.70]